MVIRKEDLADLDIVDSSELVSDGYAVYLSSTLISTNSIGNVITIVLPSDGEGLITGRDHLANAGDRVRLTGTSGGLADGYFIINSIISETSFSVNTSIVSSTGGTIYFMHPVGAKSVGFDPTGLFSITAHNVQDAIREVALSASGISEVEHEILDTLVHNIAEDGYSTVTYSGNKVINYTIWTNSLMTIKIREYQISYTIITCDQHVNQVVIKQYNPVGAVVSTLTETFVYSSHNKITNIISTKT